MSLHLQDQRLYPIPHPPAMDRIPQSPAYNDPVASQIPAGQRQNLDLLQSASHVDDQGRKYTLEVVQQPIRARMCGFGDKDRRPITPPPCIRLIVIDGRTSQPIDINEIDTSYYVLTVDLWSIDGAKEVNLVRHSATSPSISATTSSSYPPPPTPPPNFPYGPPMTQVHVGMTQTYAGGQQYGYPPASAAQYPPASQPYAQHPGYPAAGGAPPDQRPGDTQSYYTTAGGTPITPTNYYNSPAQGPLLSPSNGLMQPQDPRSAPSGMFTRNLIGSLCVSAFKLTDTDGKLGVWFILQDLSVRTEGSFRLKMNFVNVGQHTQPGSPATLNTGNAPVLATTFSDVFHVFSAKKFPGVIESTALSKCFATQGIKIPIRKDGPGRQQDDDE